jgi:hypothetical protein
MGYVCTCTFFALYFVSIYKYENRNAMFFGNSGNTTSYNPLKSNEAVISYLPSPSNLKKNSISMAIELPYSSIKKVNETYALYSVPGAIIGADAAIELAVKIINNSTSILPNFKVDIVRVNSVDETYLNDTEFFKSAGYAMDSVNTLMSNFTQETLSPSKLFISLCSIQLIIIY